MRLAFWCAAVPLAALVGCASSPPAGSEATAGVWKVYAPQDLAALKPAQRQALAAAGLTDADIAAGRLVGLHCAMMTDGWWESLGVLPAGLAVAKGRVVRLQVDDVGSNDRVALNRALEALPPTLVAGQPAYRAIPNWRELGLRNNFERIELAPALRGRYLVVQGSYLVKCRP